MPMLRLFRVSLDAKSREKNVTGRAMLGPLSRFGSGLSGAGGTWVWGVSCGMLDIKVFFYSFFFFCEKGAQSHVYRGRHMLVALASN